MAKISELPAATEVDGSELLPLLQAGIARRASIAQILGDALAPVIDAAVAEAVADLIAGGTVSASWDDITGRPSTFAPSAHTHEIDQVSGLTAALDGLAAAIDALEAAPAPAYRVGGFITNTPTASEILLAHVATDAFTLPAGLAGSQVEAIPGAGVNPAATFVLSLQKNGVEFGTISISDAGVVTVTVGAATSFAPRAGSTPADVLTVVGPAIADAAFANWALTLKGSN
jgi:hypothetical protein